MAHDLALQLRGVVPPMITPLTDTGAVDTAAIERLVDHMVAGGVSGIFVLGSSGEGPWLTDSDRRQVIRAAVQAARERVPVLAGVLEPSTTRTLVAIDHAAESGASAVVITTPYYFGADDRVIARHIETVASRAALPVMLYNIPSMTHNALHAPVVEMFINRSQIIGIKDSAGDLDNFRRLLALKAKRSDFLIFQGAETLCFDAMIEGADGIVPGMGNLVPDIFARIVDAARDGDRKTARDLQTQINQLWTLHTYDYWLVCLKYAASALGFGSGETAGHGRLTDPKAQREIRRLLQLASEVTL